MSDLLSEVWLVIIIVMAVAIILWVVVDYTGKNELLSHSRKKIYYWGRKQDRSIVPHQIYWWEGMISLMIEACLIGELIVLGGGVFIKATNKMEWLELFFMNLNPSEIFNVVTMSFFGTLAITGIFYNIHKEFYIGFTISDVLYQKNLYGKFFQLAVSELMLITVTILLSGYSQNEEQQIYLGIFLIVIVAIFILNEIQIIFFFIKILLSQSKSEQQVLNNLYKGFEYKNLKKVKKDQLSEEGVEKALTYLIWEYKKKAKKIDLQRADKVKFFSLRKEFEEFREEGEQKKVTAQLWWRYGIFNALIAGSIWTVSILMQFIAFDKSLCSSLLYTGICILICFVMGNIIVYIMEKDSDKGASSFKNKMLEFIFFMSTFIHINGYIVTYHKEEQGKERTIFLHNKFLWGHKKWLYYFNAMKNILALCMMVIRADTNYYGICLSVITETFGETEDISLKVLLNVIYCWLMKEDFKDERIKIEAYYNEIELVQGEELLRSSLVKAVWTDIQRETKRDGIDLDDSTVEKYFSYIEEIKTC